MLSITYPTTETGKSFEILSRLRLRDAKGQFRPGQEAAKICSDYGKKWLLLESRRGILGSLFIAI